MKPLSPSQRDAIEKCTGYYHQQLLDVADDHPARLWLAERGFGYHTAVSFKLGVVDVPIDPSAQQFLGRMSFPNLIQDQYGVERPVGIKYRSLTWTKESKAAKFLAPKGVAGRLYNARALANARDTLVLAEGECLPGDAEVMTPSGWVRFDEYEPGTAVLQWDDGVLSFVRPSAFVRKEWSGDLVQYKWRGYTSRTTPGHRLPELHSDGRVTFHQAYDTTPRQGVIPRGGALDHRARDILGVQFITDGLATTYWQGAQRNRTDIPFQGEVFCVTVPSTAFLVRQDGHVSVTGNTDCITASLTGIPSIAIPGINNWSPYKLRLLQGFSRVIFCKDNDEPGGAADRAALDLIKALDSVDGLEVRSMAPHKDVSEFYQAEGLEALEARVLGLDR